MSVRLPTGLHPKPLAAGSAWHRANQRDTQWPAFYGVTNAGPLKRSGRLFASSHPGRSPYWFLGWSNVTGPELGPGLRVADLCAYMDVLEQSVLDAAPHLARFDLELDPSPWVGDAHPDEPWWPS